MAQSKKVKSSSLKNISTSYFLCKRNWTLCYINVKIKDCCSGAAQRPPLHVLVISIVSSSGFSLCTDCDQLSCAVAAAMRFIDLHGFKQLSSSTCKLLLDLVWFPPLCCTVYSLYCLYNREHKVNVKVEFSEGI